MNDETVETVAQVEVVLGPVAAAGGDGLGHLADGRVVFVEGGLPTERVAVTLIQSRKDYARARLAAVVDPSSDRVAPPCPWVERGCGGCGWQHVRTGAQVALKEGVVLDALRRIAHLDATRLLAPSVPLPADGYRTSVHLAVDGEGRPAYRVRHSHDLVAVSGCGVLHPRLADLMDHVRAPGAERLTLRVGVAGGQRLVLAEPAVEVYAPPDALVVSPGVDAAFTEDVGGRRWQVSLESFFQSGPLAADAVTRLVDDAVGPLEAGDHLVDLYAGVGVLGGVVASRRPGVTLTAVEASPSAAEDAAVNLGDLDATVVCGEVGAWPPEEADVVVADPARPGLGRPGVGAVLATGCRRLVLVNCDPASFARDVSLLADGGKELVRVAVADLFPQTPHIETVSVFEG